MKVARRSQSCRVAVVTILHRHMHAMVRDLALRSAGRMFDFRFHAATSGKSFTQHKCLCFIFSQDVDKHAVSRKNDIDAMADQQALRAENYVGWQKILRVPL